MEALRIVDIWQVILHEPRVAHQEAALLMQGELEQSMLDKKIERERRQNRTAVQKTLKNERASVIAERRSLQKPVRQVSGRRGKRHEPVSRALDGDGSTRSNKRHIDIRV